MGAGTSPTGTADISRWNRRAHTLGDHETHPGREAQTAITDPPQLAAVSLQWPEERRAAIASMHSK
jgi:hypothetical protein